MKSATSVDDRFQKNLARYGYELCEVDVGDITFQAGQAESVHRWFRLTPSFAPAVVRYFIDQFDAGPSSLVFDPFSGRGTTVIECQKHGIPTVAYEINPLLAEVASRSLIWKPRRSKLFGRYRAQVSRLIRDSRRLDVDDFLRQTDISLPDIHNVFRWWRPEVLKNLLIARQTMRRPEYRTVRHYLWLCVNTAALECANIHRNHPTITFDDDHDRQIDVARVVTGEVDKIEEDLHRLTPRELSHDGLGSVAIGNSCQRICLNGKAKQKATHVITSPPYPNRFSYIHQTRPQLHFMELVDNRSAATEIDLATVGGTWGRATSDLAKNNIAVPDELAEVLDFLPELRAKSRLMANYAAKYFVDLNRHIEQLRKVTDRGFRGAYVVGNSRLSGVEIYTEGILARLFELGGFNVERIVVFRKRGGRRRLYECAVCVKG